jgi:hypothetical protein
LDITGLLCSLVAVELILIREEFSAPAASEFWLPMAPIEMFPVSARLEINNIVKHPKKYVLHPVDVLPSRARAASPSLILCWVVLEIWASEPALARPVIRITLRIAWRITGLAPFIVAFI